MNHFQSSLAPRFRSVPDLFSSAWLPSQADRLISFWYLAFSAIPAHWLSTIFICQNIPGSLAIKPAMIPHRKYDMRSRTGNLVASQEKFIASGVSFYVSLAINRAQNCWNYREFDRTSAAQIHSHCDCKWIWTESSAFRLLVCLLCICNVFY